MAIIKFIGLIFFTWLFTTGAAPIQFIKDSFNVGQDSEPKTLFGQVAQKLLNCDLCMGFWFGLIFYQNIWYACIISITSEIWGRVWSKLF